mmetsp:Transcript_7923/g.15421  ORF Transcript_7923/g.15421 Transcript_7923/m.15421 type:complete len:164 (+) Transcript_7923:268-759(+)
MKSMRDVLIAFFRLLNIATAICSGLCLTALGMAIADGPAFADSTGWKDQVMRLYGVAFAIGIILLETEWPWVLVYVPIMNNWCFRAIFQVFLALLTVKFTVSVGETDFEKSIAVYRSLAGSSLGTCAGVYFVAGLICSAYSRKTSSSPLLSPSLRSVEEGISK